MTNKLKYFVGNWKMFGDFASFKIIDKVIKFSKNFKKSKNSKIIFCIPNTLIHSFKRKIKSNNVYLGAQNCHYNNEYGSYTGSVNAYMLKKAGAQFVILGHSENRKEGDTNNIIKKKIQSALKQKLNIIFCIGETLKEKRNRKTFIILKKQLKNSLDKKFNMQKIIFAYEPVWSIGTNMTPNQQELKKNIIFIKKQCKKYFKIVKAKVLYGGSVNEKNIRKFSSISDIDGFLIGGASQSSKKFIDIMKNYYK